MMPYPDNFCGGNFQDWLEINLIDSCNAKCSWCVERNGFKPEYHAPWNVIVEEALKSGKAKIILLGGEPTLYKDLSKVSSMLSAAGKKVYITTNGSLLTSEFVANNLRGLTGLNISIHSDDFKANSYITHVLLTKEHFYDSIHTARILGISVRLNCNLIKGHIDSAERILNYIQFARYYGVKNVRFSELKNDDGSFVNLNHIFPNKYGCNDDPFTCGCSNNTVINDVEVNFRQMCGLQTPHCIYPTNPQQFSKKVLYYDGKTYDGWQTIKENIKEEFMTDSALINLLNNVAKGTVSVDDAQQYIAADIIARTKDTNTVPEKVVEKVVEKKVYVSGGSGCAY